MYSETFKRYYVGLTEDISKRIKQHNFGYVKFTKPYLPWKIVFKENCDNRVEARKREKYLKSVAGRRWRKNNMGM